MPIDPEARRRRIQRFLAAEYSFGRGGPLQDMVELPAYVLAVPEDELDELLSTPDPWAGLHRQGKTLVPRLLHAVQNSTLYDVRLLMKALENIARRHVGSRQLLATDTQPILYWANGGDPSTAQAARAVLNEVALHTPIVVPPQYYSKAGDVYQFYATMRDLFSRAKTDLLFVDNYADHEACDYVFAVGQTKTLGTLRVLTNAGAGKDHAQRMADLRLAAEKLHRSCGNISVEVRSAKDIHDRFLILDGSESWSLGPSLKDGGGKAGSINQLLDKARDDALADLAAKWKIAAVEFHVP
jgi:hypothetical protein